jgi:16S rRNA (adenine1518-N6/adenine1519-N6)-dimethyltransferase
MLVKNNLIKAFGGELYMPASDANNNLCSAQYIREVMVSAGVTFKKGYGQNFLINPVVPKKTADAAAKSGAPCALEIGPGIGALTAELCARFERVVAVEIDETLIPILNKTLASYDNVTIIKGDFLDVDIKAISREIFGGKNYAVCANLPYYITSPIIMKLLEAKDPSMLSITLMVQSEVATRLTASPGTSDYGAITVAVSYYGRARRLFSVSPGSFMPQPKVSSAVISIELYKKGQYPVNPKDEELMFALMRAAFGKRRKMLINALTSASLPKRYGSGVKITKEIAKAAVELANVDPSVRGETLSISQFAALSDALCDIISPKL